MRYEILNHDDTLQTRGFLPTNGEIDYEGLAPVTLRVEISPGKWLKVRTSEWLYISLDEGEETP